MVNVSTCPQKKGKTERWKRGAPEGVFALVLPKESRKRKTKAAA
jgi:hypothetical protein